MTSSPPASPAESGTTEPSRSRLYWIWSLLLIVAACAAIYYPVGGFQFLNFDDDLYVYLNPWLKRGISWDSLSWAFQAQLVVFSQHAEYWSPITLLTRLLDGQFYGVEHAGGHHVTSALIHGANALMLFCALNVLTGLRTRSLLVALLFAVHPLNVEPVAWLSARKDLVSAFFFFLTLAVYGHYCHRLTKGRYALLLCAFMAGLMSKPMVVTVPAVLLLLDYWPLKRWQRAWPNREELIRLVAEKLPLFIMAGIGAFFAVVSQKEWGALEASTAIPLSTRLANATMAYANFVRRLFWPNDLALYYPYPDAAAPGFWMHVAGAAIILLFVSVAVICLARRRPELLVGWLWFLGVLLPVIGIIQIGHQATADRYAYPSMVGLFIVVVWIGADAFAKMPRLGISLATVGIIALGVVSSRQLWTWQDSVSAFSQAIKVTKNNDVAYLNLGSAYYVKGDLPRARENFMASLHLQPVQPKGWNNLAAVEAALGNDSAALQAYDLALRMDPKEMKSHFFMGKLLLKHGDFKNGEAHLRRASELEPAWAEPYAELARIAIQQKRWADAEQAIDSYRKIRPNAPDGKSLAEQLARAKMGDLPSSRGAN